MKVWIVMVNGNFKDCYVFDNEEAAQACKDSFSKKWCITAIIEKEVYSL